MLSWSITYGVCYLFENPYGSNGSTRIVFVVEVFGIFWLEGRKMLGLRHLLRDHIWINVGNGMRTFAWFDKWDDICPIARMITPRMIANVGFSMTTKLAEVCEYGEWLWPDVWTARYPALAQLQIVTIDQTRQDRLEWKTSSGQSVEFNTATAWDAIRFKQNEVSWAKLAWFPQAIPRHSFLMWLLVQKVEESRYYQ
ncbi:uncharacterized protein LOC110943555 [Helianthus annuus]|uniref:uncharacterized protein LOC110943555 n=1 Tax=Helianthus annuus TaxID=4232 RepID=UPI000B90A41B|nr:uncharacterized protein LOC110943555 [Helianthus annuus]